MTPAGEDFELLRRYSQERDEGAFALVERRYADLVYSSAVRRVGNRQLAEDVAQATFIVLARKAGSLRGGRNVPLSAWLLRTVRYAAANAVKGELRRRKRERAGRHEMSDAASSNPTDVLIWQDIARQLDDAVLRLPASDRQVVLMRYFEDRGMPEIAATLNLSEAAARQRLSRALDKLRRRLSGGGGLLFGMDSAAFAAMLASHVIRPAPAMLVGGAKMLAGGAAGSAGGSIAKGALKMMTLAKTQVAAAFVAIILIGGTGGVIAIKDAMAQDDRSPAVSAPLASTAAVPLVLDRHANNGIISVDDAPPVVISTDPVAGATDVDAAATTEIRVTFSKDMEPGSYSWVQFGKDTFPAVAGKAHFLDDKRTCVLPVRLQPGHPYVIWLNHDPYMNFMDSSNRSAVPYLLVFETRK